MKNIHFPYNARKQIADYILGLTDNPYISWKEIRYQVSSKFIAILEEQAAYDKSSGCTDILDIIRESAANKILSTSLLIRQFPVDRKEDLLDPPSDATNYNCYDPAAIGKKTFVSEFALLALMTALGLDFHINTTLQNGWFMQHVAVKQQKKDTGTHAGAGFFPLHSDGAHLPDNELIDVVALLTLRNAKTKSILVSHISLEAALRQKLKSKFDILTQPRFMFTASKAYDTPANLVSPILCINQLNGERRWRVQGNRDLLRPSYEDDAEAASVLADFFDVLDDITPTHCFAMAYGDLLLIDNLRGYVHTREPIDLTYENKRHLMRAQGRYTTC